MHTSDIANSISASSICNDSGSVYLNVIDVNGVDCSNCTYDWELTQSSVSQWIYSDTSSALLSDTGTLGTGQYTVTVTKQGCSAFTNRVVTNFVNNSPLPHCKYFG